MYKDLSEAPELCSWIDAGGDAFKLASANKVKDDPGLYSAVFELGSKKYFCKCFQLKGLKGVLQKIFGVDRARQLNKKSKRLFEEGVAIARPLGVVVSNTQALWFSEVLPFRSLLYRVGEALPGTQFERAEIIDAALSAMCALHKAGYSHGDFKWANLLYDEQRKQIWIVDLDRVKKRRSKQFGQSSARDLARFLLDCEEAGVPREEYDSLYESYAKQLGLSESPVRDATQPILRKLQRRHVARYGAGYRLSPPAH